MTSVAISQSNYIPWKGYFDLIASVDVFILYDDMQYTKRDWRNRNKLKTPKGASWLTVPVEVKGKYHQKINETLVSDPQWPSKHWQTIKQHYRQAPYFNDIAQWLEPLYLENNELLLSKINQRFIRAICNHLGILTTIRCSSEFTLADGKTERLVDLCKQLKATQYTSGPSAKNYIEPELFAEQNIQLTWFDHSSYPVYSQLYGEFEHSVTILDLLFNVGTDAGNYLKFVK